MFIASVQYSFNRPTCLIRCKCPHINWPTTLILGAPPLSPPPPTLFCIGATPPFFIRHCNVVKKTVLVWFQQCLTPQHHPRLYRGGDNNVDEEIRMRTHHQDTMPYSSTKGDNCSFICHTASSLCDTPRPFVTQLWTSELGNPRLILI